MSAEEVDYEPDSKGREWPTILSSVLTLKITTPYLLAISELLLVLGPARLTLSHLVTLVTTPVLIDSVARFVSKPRGKPLPEGPTTRAVRMMCSDLGIAPPSILVHERSGQHAYLRGWKEKAAIVVTRGTLTLWQKQPELHLAQLAHELAHLKSRDLVTYYRLLALSVVSVVSMTALMVLTPLRHPLTGSLLRAEVLFAIAAGALVLSLRSLLRFREHAADTGAAMLLGKPTLDAIPEGDSSVFSRILGTHPPNSQRRRALEHPEHLVLSVLPAFFALGFALAVTARMSQIYLTTLLGNQRAFHVSLVLSGVVGGAAAGRFLKTHTILSSGRVSYQVSRQFRALGAGILAAYFILVPRYDWVTLLAAVIVALVGSRLVGYLSVGISMLFLLLGNYFGRIYLTALYAIGPALLLVTLQETYLAGLLQPLIRTVQGFVRP